MALDEDRIQITRRGQVAFMALQSLAISPSLRTGMLGATLTVRSGQAEVYTLKGAGHSAASDFSEQVVAAWTRVNLEALEKEVARLDPIITGMQSLRSPSRYPAACQIAPLLDDARDLDVSLLSKLNADAVGPEVVARIAPVRKFAADPRSVRADSIAMLVTAELDRLKDFFDTIESKPLTPEQRLSVVVDEDATLVLAGAGSGTTSIITAKATYLVKAGIRKPEEILLLAFAKNAAKEMSERVESRSGVPIVAQTFHALAYDIIGIVEGSKSALADHATDDMAFSNLIKQILKDLVYRLSEVSRAIIQFFAHFLVEPKTEWDFKTKHDFYTHMESQDLRILQGEKVRSYEELQIANWLYENGVDYGYEPLYKHKVSEIGRRDYQPDFRLTESGIYIEHFRVRREKARDGSEKLVTAPFVDRDEYLAGMTWKRKVHAEHQTTLIETYSYERQEGCLLTGLAEKLATHVTLSPRPVDTIYDRIVELKQVDDFSKLLGTFLRKFMSGGYCLQDCETKSDRMKLGKRARAFLDVFAPVLEEYQKRLEGRIDFEDMILRAARYAETGRYVSPFRHILVDESQDISQSRARLVKALKAQHQDVRVFAVGDDWQSIFRFAGSDIHLMRHFGREFGGRFDGETGVQRTVDLGRTFQSVDQIAFAARTFVLQNPAQIDKKIVPAGTATEPAIRVASVSKGGDEGKLNDVLFGLSAAAALEAKAATVLVLGRYRFNEPDMQGLRRRFLRLKISFKTDEFVNMTGQDRAAVARDKKADFFFCCHFNAETSVIGGHDIFVNLDVTQVTGVVDTNHRFNVTATPGHLGGSYPKAATTRNASRGPLILRSDNASLPSDVSSKITVVGGAISRNLAAVLQQAEGSPVPATDQGIRNQGLANVSPVNLGMTTKGNRKIVPIYLEADYINVESGDRLWNAVQYTANLPAAYTRWGIPPEPAQPDMKAAWQKTHKRRTLPALPAGHDIFGMAAESIATTLLTNMNHRIC